MVNRSTSKPSFSVVYQKPPNHTFDLVPVPKILGYNIAANNIVEKIEAIQADVRLKLEAFMLNIRRTETSIAGPRFMQKVILLRINDNAYVVYLPKDMAISNTFNVSDLVDYYPRDELLYHNENSRSSHFQVGENDEGDSQETN
nr:putative nucleotidyltransferase, ribonuclease H [Tanacetum cinerariifolium]